MNFDSLEKLKTAAGLACQLRNLLEELEQDLKDAGDHELAWDYEDFATEAGTLENNLDIQVEIHS